MRLLNQKLVQRDPSAPKRINAQRGLNFACRKQRLASRLSSVDHQAADGHAHGQPADGHGPEFHPSTGGSFQTADQEPFKHGVASAAAEKDHEPHNRENGEHPRGVNDPAPNRVAAPLFHFATPASRFSMRRRSRLSFSHCSACWLMPFWTRAS